MNFEKFQEKEKQVHISLLNEKVDYLIYQLSLLGEKMGEVHQPPEEEKGDIIQVKEAAEIIGRSESTVYIKASKKQIPCWNDGGRLLFSRKELKDWVLANRTKKTEESTKSRMKNLRSRYAKK